MYAIQYFALWRWDSVSKLADTVNSAAEQQQIAA